MCTKNNNWWYWATYERGTIFINLLFKLPLPWTVTNQPCAGQQLSLGCPLSFRTIDTWVHYLPNTNLGKEHSLSAFPYFAIPCFPDENLLYCLSRAHFNLCNVHAPIPTYPGMYAGKLVSWIKLQLLAYAQMNSSAWTYREYWSSFLQFVIIIEIHVLIFKVWTRWQL